MKLKCISLLITISLTGCASPKYSEYEMGKIWCNDRYLQTLTPQPIFHDKYFTIAERGYIYAVAAALTLQSDSSESQEHYFPLPERLVSIDKEPKDKASKDKSGFEVETFKLYETNKKEKVKEIIIAFAGSNELHEWVWTNLFSSKKQYDLARKYVIKIAKEYPENRIVVSGISLGGGLAVHVGKDPETKSLIDEVWALNPSPKTYSNSDMDHKIWMAAVEGESLAKFRTPIFRVLPGFYKIGSYDEQTADGYYLVESNNIYSHFRWVLIRNMLHAADLSIYKRIGSESTEPLEILKASRFKSCKKETS